MTTLVVPDVHNHIAETEAQIARYPADRVIFLGDYFDHFGDTPQTAAATAEWLKDSLHKADRLHLWGNHDLSYRFPNNDQFVRSGAGYTPAKQRALDSVLGPEDWAKLHLLTFVDGIALSHAGIGSPAFFSPGVSPTRESVERLCEQAWSDAESGVENPVFGPLGIVWLRWWQLRPLAAFSQVVGHTPDRALRTERGEGQLNVCLDTFGRYLGWIEQGRLGVIDDRLGEISWQEVNEGN